MTATAMKTRIQDNATPDLTNTTACLRLTIGSVGNTRKVRSSEYELESTKQMKLGEVESENGNGKIDKSMTRVSKKLYDSEELAAINHFDGDTRRLIFERCLPFPIPGVYLVALQQIIELDNILEKRIEQRQKLIDKFVERVPELQAESMRRLGPLANPTEYLSAEELRKQFDMTWIYVTLGPAPQLKLVDVKKYERAEQSVRALYTEAAQEMIAVRREAMLELVANLKNRLADVDDGNPKKFRESAINNVIDWLALWDKVQPKGSDEETRKLVEQAKKLLKGCDRSTLIEADSVRERVKEGMTQIAKQLDGMLINRPSRKFRLDED